MSKRKKTLEEALLEQDWDLDSFDEGERLAVEVCKRHADQLEIVAAVVRLFRKQVDIESYLCI